MHKLKWALVAAFAIGIVVLNLWGLEDYPAPYCDETVLANMGYHLIADGTPSLDLISDVDDTLYPSLLYEAGVGVFLHTLGNTLWVARLFSLLGWITASVFVYLVGQQLFDQLTGLLSAAIFAVSLHIFWASHWARPEIWVVAASMGLIFYYLRLHQSPSLRGFVILGLLAILILEVHPNTIWFSLPLGLLAVFTHYRTAAGRWRLIAAVLAAIITAILLVLIHFLSDPVDSTEESRFLLTYASDGAPESAFDWDLLTSLALLARDVRDGYFLAFNGVVVLYTLCTLVGAIFAALRRESGDRVVLVLWLGSILAFVLFMPHKPAYYRPLWDALSALLIGSAAVGIGARLASYLPSRLSHAAAAALLCTPLIVLNLLMIGWLSYKYQPRNLDHYGQSIMQYIPADQPAIGPAILWHGFHNRNPYTATNLFYYQAIVDGSFTYSTEDFDQIFETLDIRYAIHDGTMDCQAHASPQSAIYGDYLAATCDRVGTVDDPYFGTGAYNLNGDPTLIYHCPTP